MSAQQIAPKATLLSPSMAIGLSCLFFFSYCFTDAMAKHLQYAYDNRFQILCVVNTICLILLHGAAVGRYKKDWRIIYKTEKKMLHGLRMLASIGVTSGIMIAVSLIPFTNFYGLIFTAPFFATCFAKFLSKEDVPLKRWALITLGFAGVVIVLIPDIEAGGSIFGYMAAITAAICFALGSFCAKTIGQEKTNFTLPLFTHWAIFIFNLPMCIAFFEPMSISDLPLFFIYSAVLCFGVALNSYTFANTPSLSLVIPFQYTQIIWAVLIGFFFFEEPVHITAMMGIAIIITSGLCLFFMKQPPAPSHEEPSENKRNE